MPWEPSGFLGAAGRLHHGGGVGGAGQRRPYWWSRQGNGVNHVETEDRGEVGRFGIESEGRLLMGDCDTHLAGRQAEALGGWVICPVPQN